MRPARTLSGIVLISILAFGCAKPEPTQPLPENVSFAAHIQPLIAERCSKCHVEGTKGKLSMKSLEDALVGGKSGPVIVPGDGENSRLYALITSSKDGMPPKGEPLSSYQVSLFKKWIDQGAL